METGLVVIGQVDRERFTVAYTLCGVLIVFGHRDSQWQAELMLSWLKRVRPTAIIIPPYGADDDGHADRSGHMMEAYGPLEGMLV